MSVMITPEKLAGYFDHSFLKAYFTHDDLVRFCGECTRYKFKMAAVNSVAVKDCKELLRGSGIRVGAAVGFPLGQTTIECKAFETRKAIEDGANEIDYVLNIGRLRSGDVAYIEEEMRAIVQVCREHGVTSKVILETCYLSDEEKKAACGVAVKALPDFVKTSTGFGNGGATVADVLLMKEAVGGKVKIKASGGIKDLKTALDMIEAGAGRIGTSYSADIMRELERMMK